MSSSTNERMVTRQDLAAALVAMGCLPKRTSVDPAMEFAAYEVAVDGVRALDLAAAVQSVLRGALGHAFFPAPPELRMRCDAVRRERLDALADAEREAARRRAMAEQIAERRAPGPSPEARERVAKIMREFNMRWQMDRNQEPPLSEISARLSPDVAKLPNQPTNSEAWAKYLTRLEIEAARRAMR